MHVPAPVPRQKRHRPAVQRAGQDLVRRRAEGALHLAPLRAFQPLDLVDARAADHPDHGLCHALSFPCCPRGFRRADRARKACNRRNGRKMRESFGAACAVQGIIRAIGGNEVWSSGRGKGKRSPHLSPSNNRTALVRTSLAAFAKTIAMPDLRVMQNEPFSLARLRIELLSGLTVALALVPEAVAFAFVAGVHPLVGLYAAFLVGLITALIGGRPGMISGATGALAVVMVALVAAARGRIPFCHGGADGDLPDHGRRAEMGQVHPPRAASRHAGLRQWPCHRDLSRAARPVQGARHDGRYRARHGRRRVAERDAPSDDAGPRGADDAHHLGHAAYHPHHSRAARGDRRGRGAGHRLRPRRAARRRSGLDRGRIARLSHPDGAAHAGDASRSSCPMRSSSPPSA